MIDVMNKLKEIAESGYESEDVQRGIEAAAKTQPETTVVETEEEAVENVNEDNGETGDAFNMILKGIRDILQQMGGAGSKFRVSMMRDHPKLSNYIWKTLVDLQQTMVRSLQNGQIVAEKIDQNEVIDEVHEDVDSELEDILNLSGRSGVLGMARNTNIIAESLDAELEEGGSGDTPISKMSRAELIDYLGTTDAEVANMSDDELRDAANEKTMDMQSVDNNQPAVEETVEVPVQALEELLQLAGYTDYKSKVEEYSNEPEEAVSDTETQLIGLSGGLNRPKKQFAKAQDGDNAMAVEANETNESQETAIESFYKKYDEFVQSLNKQD